MRWTNGAWGIAFSMTVHGAAGSAGRVNAVPL